MSEDKGQDQREKRERERRGGVKREIIKRSVATLVEKRLRRKRKEERDGGGFVNYTGGLEKDSAGGGAGSGIDRCSQLRAVIKGMRPPTLEFDTCSTRVRNPLAYNHRSKSSRVKSSNRNGILMITKRGYLRNKNC